MGGGKYTATQNADGTWNILDVPICGEVPAGEKFAKSDVDKAWLQKAVDKHLIRFKEGFEAPLHIHHHGTEKETIPAGTFIPRRVGKIQHSGETSNAIFADLTHIPANVFSEIEAGKFPYISVELGSWDDGEFTSCSLLDDERPYFAFPKVTVGTKVYSFTAEAERIAKPAGVAVAFRATGTDGRGLILCKFGGGIKLADDEDKDEAAKDKDRPAFGKDKSEDSDESDDEEKPTEVDQNPAVEGGDVMAILKQLLVTTNLIAKNLSGVGGVAAQDDDKDDENEAPVEQEKPMSDEKDKERPAASKDSEIKLQARVDALEADRDERKQQDAIKARADAAVVALKGWHINDKMRSRIQAFAAEGQKQLDLYVESIKADVPKDPPTTLSAFEQTVGATAGDPEIEKVMQQYASRGPEVQEQVRGFIALYAEAKQNRLTTLSCESFVKAQFRGLQARVPVGARG